MAVDLNIDTTKVQPVVSEIKEKYLMHLVASAIVAILIWLATDVSYGSMRTVLGYFLDPLVLLLGFMLLSYMILVVVSNDALISRLRQTGYLDALNGKLIYAMVISTLAFFLNLIMILWFMGKWGTVAILHEILFVALVFICVLAFVFFLTVVLDMTKLAELRAPSQSE